MSTTHVMDILASNSVLSRIFEYLEPDDVTSCQWVSRLFHSEIQRNLNKKKKKSIRMKISTMQKGFLITFFAEHRYWLESTGTSKGCDVIYYENYKPSSRPIPVETHYDTQLEFLRDVIETLAMKFTIENMELMENSSNRTNVVYYSAAELCCIFESIRGQSPSISLANMTLNEQLVENIMKIDCPLLKCKVGLDYHLLKQLKLSRTKLLLSAMYVPTSSIEQLLMDWSMGVVDILHISQKLEQRFNNRFNYEMFTQFCRHLPLQRYTEDRSYEEGKTHYLTRQSGGILRFAVKCNRLELNEISEETLHNVTYLVAVE